MNVHEIYSESKLSKIKDLQTSIITADIDMPDII